MKMYYKKWNMISRNNEHVYINVCNIYVVITMVIEHKSNNNNIQIYNTLVRNDIIMSG